MSRRVLIVKAGSTLPEIARQRGDFEQWIALGMGLREAEVDVVAPFRDEPLRDAAACRAIVVTGSADFASDREPWSERTGVWLARAVAAEVPVLAICYGHQLLAQATGGEVGRNPRGREIGTVEVDLSAAIEAADPLLGALPARARVQATHVESVLSLPPEARLLGSNPADLHHAFALGPCAWGVQFHPEFDAEVMRGYVRSRASDLADEGLDAETTLAAVRETPVGTDLLRRFAELAAANDPDAAS